MKLLGNNFRQGRRGFTLVELLVVIGIIGLLVSILIPALSKARKAAQTVQCMSNLRQIGQGLIMYTAQNDGWLPGSPVTTSGFLLYPPLPYKIRGPYSILAVNTTLVATPVNPGMPNVLDYYDFESPIARVMGLPIDLNGSGIDILTRFQQVNTYGAFVCPANQLALASYVGGMNWQTMPPPPMPSPWGPHTTPSYCEAMPFAVSGVAANKYQMYVGFRDCLLPNSYVPKISKVGATSLKIFCADGARWSMPNNPPDVCLGPSDDLSCEYADPGPWDTYTRCWSRDSVPGMNGNGENSDNGQYDNPAVDPRAWAYRHGIEGYLKPSDSYKFNAVFFDGHVETLGDLEGANPLFWGPKGTKFFTMYTDVSRRFAGGNSTFTAMQ